MSTTDDQLNLRGTADVHGGRKPRLDPQMFGNESAVHDLHRVRNAGGENAVHVALFESTVLQGGPRRLCVELHRGLVGYDPDFTLAYACDRYLSAPALAHLICRPPLPAIL